MNVLEALELDRMFRETMIFKTAKYSEYDWLAKIRQPIFCRVPSALQLRSVSAFQNRTRGKSCVVERGVSGTNPFRHLALRNATPPEGGGLGNEGEFCPHKSTTRTSCPVKHKLHAIARASPFRERWHGEAVTERVCFRDEPSQSPTATALPKGEPLAKRAGLVLIRQQQGEACR